MITSTSLALRASAVLLALALACDGGSPAAPDPGESPDPGAGLEGDLAIVWDGRTADWGAPEVLRAELDGQPVDVEWRSLSDSYLDQPAPLGIGPTTTTAPLRPGTSTVEARIVVGGQVAKRTTTPVTVRYRESWNLTLEGMVPYADQTVGDVWVEGGLAYVARRTAGGISIVDLAGMREIGRFTAAGLFTQDIKAADGVAYVSNETNQYPFAVTLLDVSDPTTPKVLGGVPTPEVGVAHNIWIDGDLLALASQATSAIHLYDVSDPTAPIALSVIHPGADGTAHDVHVRRGYLYGSYMHAELVVASVADPANPRVTARVTYPQASQTHSSWLAIDGSTLYVADEVVNAPIRIFDVSNPMNPVLRSTYQPRLGTVPHNFQVQNGRFAYLSHYKHGVEVVDVSDPTRPRLIGFYDTHPGIDNDSVPPLAGSLGLSHEKEGGLYEGAWGVHWTADGRIVVSDMNRGLFVFRYTGD